MSEASESAEPQLEYGILPRRRPRQLSDEERTRFNEEYGRIRTYFKLRPDDYLKLQRWLTQARIPQTYDKYLARSAKFAITAGVLGAVVGLLLTWFLSTTGLLSGISSGISNPIAVFVGDHRVAFAALVVVPLTGIVFAATTWFARYYYPSSVVSSRRQNINVVLPHAIVYMYALSYGGMGLLEIVRSIAESEETYGEVAREFELVLADTELLGSDLHSALRNARNLTPSDGFEQFLDDMVSVLESGGDLTSFFSEESETYLRHAQDEQAAFLETLALLAEVFVVGFVAAPLFLIVTLVVISFIGGQTIGPIMMLVYVVMPLGALAFLLLLDTLSGPLEQVRTVPTYSLDESGAAPPDEADERLVDYRHNKRQLRIRELLSDPLGQMRAEPIHSLALSIPTALVFTALVLGTGLVEPTLGELQAAPVTTTTALVLLPLMIVAVPLTVFHEIQRRRDTEIAHRFPDTLNILSSANRMGIPITEAMELVSRWSSGPMAEELQTVRNDITWNNDTTNALLAFGARLRVPQLTRTMKLLSDGLRSSGDLSKVLSIAAEDTRNRDRLSRARQRELSSYIAVVIIGFLVYLLVILLLDASFIGPLEAIQNPSSPDDVGAPVSFINVPIGIYRMVFFHSALIMAVGTGLIAGKLSTNDTFDGLKYAIALAAITLVAFLFI